MRSPLEGGDSAIGRCCIGLCTPASHLQGGTQYDESNPDAESLKTVIHGNTGVCGTNGGCLQRHFEGDYRQLTKKSRKQILLFLILCGSVDNLLKIHIPIEFHSLKAKRMWISSLVLTLSAEPIEAVETINALKSLPVFTVGVPVHRKLPVVIEAEDGQASRDWYEWVESLPAVEHVELAFVSFDESESDEAMHDESLVNA